MTPSCRECQTIELEYRKACFDYWANSSVEIKEAARFLRRLAGGSEDDVVRLGNFPPKEPDSPKMAEVRVRQSQHWSLTGHYVNLPQPYSMLKQ